MCSYVSVCVFKKYSGTLMVVVVSGWLKLELIRIVFGAIIVDQGGCCISFVFHMFHNFVLELVCVHFGLMSSHAKKMYGFESNRTAQCCGNHTKRNGCEFRSPTARF